MSRLSSVSPGSRNDRRRSWCHSTAPHVVPGDWYLCQSGTPRKRWGVRFDRRRLLTPMSREFDVVRSYRRDLDARGFRHGIIPAGGSTIEAGFAYFEYVRNLSEGGLASTPMLLERWSRGPLGGPARRCTAISQTVSLILAGVSRSYHREWVDFRAGERILQDRPECILHDRRMSGKAMWGLELVETRPAYMNSRALHRAASMSPQPARNGCRCWSTRSGAKPGAPDQRNGDGD